MKVAVVVSTWIENPPSQLLNLCASLARYPAGIDYELILSANGPGYAPPESVRASCAHTFVRENVGWNLRAWDHAWRNLPEYDRFLFLQDDCTAGRRGWLQAFARRFEVTKRCGLVGEKLQRSWDRPWDELCAAVEDRPDAIARAEWARSFAANSRSGTSQRVKRRVTSRSVVQFTERRILEQVGGYRYEEGRLEATAAEIAFSRAVEAHGTRSLRWAATRTATSPIRSGRAALFFPGCVAASANGFRSSHQSKRTFVIAIRPLKQTSTSAPGVRPRRL